jgi:AraC family transcriptional regulator, regulatory protein of adaptative response / methylated-DNA-[protein]-cysteine methyltransferase
MNAEYPIIEQALIYIEKNFKNQPELDEIASHLNISPSHLQRTFKDWVGISPKRFLQFLTIDHARKLLQESRSVLEATFESGLSSPGRIHDLFVNIDAVTPGEFKEMGKGLKIEYGQHQSPFGICTLATTQRGLCFMGFHSKAFGQSFMDDMTSRFPEAIFKENKSATQVYFAAIFNPNHSKKKLTLFLKGTNFQIKVWEALLKIPSGNVCSYGDISKIIGRPKANQAVGSAVGANPVSYLIPCHRVIQNMGIFGDYHWGSARKKAMLIWESQK